MKTKLQTARDMIMKQLALIDKGDYSTVEVNGVVELSDVLTKTYNTELRTKELEIKARNTEITMENLDVFNKK